MANDLNIALGNPGRGLPDCRPAPVCDPRPVCPACGGLECLCRPRFFAGQLLSEEDLNRLDHYIVAKNRLHNRYLFGSGVVCGLEVVCGKCDPAGGGTVVVKPGYALSPCGNDIVVCHNEPVNVCDLINRCRPPSNDCLQPAGRVNAADCNQGDEDWILAICYQEKPSRGITALRGASCRCGGGCQSTGGCGCGCGGHAGSTTTTTSGSEASCGCGGGGGGTKTSRHKHAAKAGPVPPQCEPTLTCEGYCFAVYKVPLGDPAKVDPGPLIMRLYCCLIPLFERLTSLPDDHQSPRQLQGWLNDLIAAVREFLIDEGLYDCDVAARLSTIGAPALGGARAEYTTKWNSATLDLLEILAAIVQKCLCASLLPPCPPPDLHDCVPIATVTVTREHCRVKHICNVGSRRFLVTWPSLQYWFSWVPLVTSWGKQNKTIRDLINGICCTPISEFFGDIRRDVADLRRHNLQQENVHLPNPVNAIGRGGAIHPFTQLLAESFAGGSPANAASILLAAMGARGKDDAPLVSETALEYPGQAMLIQQIVGPALAPLLPLLGGAAKPSNDMNAMAREIETLKEKVSEQQIAIRKLQKR
jgi:hypothetical protein